jgi:hypothetical protein
MAVSGADIVNTAAKEIGDPYVFGAEGPNAFDCSGLVEYVFHKFGIKTPRIAADQAHFGTAVSRNKIQPGDLIFFSWSGNTNHADHVGIYAGNGQMIDAPRPGASVEKVKLGSYYWANTIGIRRFPGVTGGPATSESSSRLGAVADAATGGLTGALGQIGASMGDIAKAALQVEKVAEGVTKLFLPSNIMRGAAALAGTLFLLIGIFFLTREVKG